MSYDFLEGDKGKSGLARTWPHVVVSSHIAIDKVVEGFQKFADPYYEKDPKIELTPSVIEREEGHGHPHNIHTLLKHNFEVPKGAEMAPEALVHENMEYVIEGYGGQIIIMGNPNGIASDVLKEYSGYHNEEKKEPKKPKK